MIITGMRTVRVDVPLDRPIKTAIHDVRSVGCVLVFLDTDAGLTGESYMFTMNAARLDVLEAMARSLEALVVGRDPHEVEDIWRAMWADVNFIGWRGVTIIGMSSVEVACWDLIGKAAGVPLHRHFGGRRDAIKAYASGGLWLSQPVDELVAEAHGFLRQGFRAMKVRVGKPEIAEDVARVAAVRQAVGPDIDLMVDSNQSLNVARAIDLAKALAPSNLVWFEEPVPYTDLKGHAAIRAAIDTPLASGESEYTSDGLAAMIEAGAADILMPDLQRIGGYGEFRRIAALAAEHDIPVSPHIFSEQSLAIAGGCENVNYLEHMPWFEPLYNERMALKDGMIAMPEGPGIGFTFDMDAVERLRIG